MSLENGKCPSCNGALILDASKEKAVCKYCGNEIVIQQAVQKCVVDGIATFDSLLLAAQQAIDFDQDYDLARKKYREALNLQPNDYRVIWGIFLCEAESIKWYQRTKGYIQYYGDLQTNMDEVIYKWGERARNLAPAEIQPYYFQIINETRNYFNTAPTKSTKSGGCYVATCVYGSYDCPEVWVLRRYRDNNLSQNLFGRLFIRTYYAISPTIVKIFGNTKIFKKVFRVRLDRMIEKLKANGVEDKPYDDRQW